MKLSHAILVVALLCLGDVSFANTSDLPELICQFDKSTMIKEKLKKAQECINNGNYSGAKNYLNGVLKLDPNNAKAKELLAVCNNGGKPDAVYLGKLYVVTTFLSNLLVLFNGDFEATGLGSLPQIVRGLVWGIIWYAFLCLSTRVEEVIPKEYRKKSSKDYIITIALYLIPIVFFIAGVASLQTDHQKQQEEFVQTAQLGVDEYTDGKMIFKLPEGFTSEREELQDPKLTVFNLENENIGSVTMCSDYDTDMSQKNFNQYCKGWEDESAKQYTSSVVCNEKRSINGRTYWYKVTSYETNGTVYWRFILLFDNASGKVAVISAYDGGYDSYVEELLNSIRFK